jgi:hypothetical protein
MNPANRSFFFFSSFANYFWQGALRHAVEE